jgi:ParB-like chromosome segregation protein Spo0J
MAGNDLSSVDQPVLEVDISTIGRGESIRENAEDLDNLDSLMAANEQLPPIIVHRRTMKVIDGIHRLRAAEIQGKRNVPVVFFDGTEGEAFVLAVKTNVRHGLPLSLAERKAAARRIIGLYPQWSDRKIASVAGISAGTVAEIRNTAEATPGRSAEMRLGRDGRLRPVDGTKGRRKASELIAENPGLSLRQVARQAGISPETVRDVRRRMRDGKDPVRVGKTGREGSWPRQARRRTVPAPQEVLSSAAIQNRIRAVSRLRADPALRFSESGRSLIRLLSAHGVDEGAWRTMIDNVPAHCSARVAGLCRELAEMWAEAAARLDAKASGADPAQGVVLAR